MRKMCRHAFVFLGSLRRNSTINCRKNMPFPRVSCRGVSILHQQRAHIRTRAFDTVQFLTPANPWFFFLFSAIPILHPKKVCTLHVQCKWNNANTNNFICYLLFVRARTRNETPRNPFVFLG